MNPLYRVIFFRSFFYLKFHKWYVMVKVARNSQLVVADINLKGKQTGHAQSRNYWDGVTTKMTRKNV